MKKLSILWRSAFAAALVDTSASAAIVSVKPIADLFVTSGSAVTGAGVSNGNYGAAGALMVSAPGSAKGEMQSLLKFDLAAVKTSFDTTFGAGNWLVDSITLQLGTNFGTQGAQPNNPIFNTINAGVFKLDWLASDNWGEGTGNPASPFFPTNPPVDGVTFDSIGLVVGAGDKLLGTFTFAAVGNTSPPTVPPASYVLGLDAAFVADVSAGNNVSFRAYAGDTGVSYLFNSRTFGTTTSQPTLIVSANVVPEPGAGALLAGAAAVSFARRRRHANAA